MKRATLFALGLLAAPGALSGQVAGDLPEGVSTAMVEAGKLIYGGKGLCFACHGPTGAGVTGAGVDLTDDEWLHDDGTFELLVRRVLVGVDASESKSGAIMPPNGGGSITEEEARAVASYVWSLRSGPR